MAERACAPRALLEQLAVVARRYRSALRRFEDGSDPHGIGFQRAQDALFALVDRLDVHRIQAADGADGATVEVGRG